MLGFRRLSRPSTVLTLLGAAALLGVAATSVGRASGLGQPPGQRLLHLLLADRFTTGRLSGQTAWHACAARDTAAIIPPMQCGPRLQGDSRRERRIASARRALRADSSTGARWSIALLDVRSADTASAPLERALAYLNDAHRRTPTDAGVWNDLSVMNLAEGERTQQLMPMLRALNAVQRAVEIDSLRPEILFNRALILQRLYLIASARRAWTRYLAVERHPRWRAEAQRHANRLARTAKPSTWDTTLLRSPPLQLDSAVRAMIDARVAWAPHRAREFAFLVLGAWGTAVRTGDEEHATRLLALAREIGAAADRLNTDRSVGKAVHAIESASAEPDRRAALARGHQGLSDGFRFFNDYRAYERADSALRRAEEELRAAGSPMLRWATFYRAAADVDLGRYDDAYRRFESLAAAAGPDEAGLAGKARSALGVSRVRDGDYEAASRLYSQARPPLERAREGENHAAIAYLRAESLILAGQLHEGQEEGLRGLRQLSPFRESNYLNNHLSTVAAYARNDHLSHAALAVMDEVLSVARGVRKPDVLARAYRARARDLMSLGRRDQALTHLDSALAWADSMSAGKGRERTRADVLLVRAQLLRASDPRASLALLSQVVDIYREVNITLHVPVALYEAGIAAEAAGDSAAARASLDEAIDWLQRQQDTFRSTEIRATFHETVENVFDAMIRIELAAGRPASAFAYLERARAAIQPGPGSQTAEDPLASVGLAELGARLPADVLFVNYALLDDRIAVWTASRQGWRTYSVAARRDSVAQLAKRFVGEAESVQADAFEVRARLFDLLVRPLAAELSAGRRIVVVLDRELYQVPFAALWDRARRRYLVQDHQVTVVPSAAFYVAASGLGNQRMAGGSALVVGNPTLSRDAAVRLEPLPHAGQEARAIARLYPRSLPLVETGATRAAVLSQLATYSIFHFAGHAVFNGEQPGASYLALAPNTETGDDGRLTAAEIGALGLPDLRVVILSACSTLSPRPSRAGATTGLAYSFLRAGAPATISTLWDVVDGRTGPLLTEFHRRFAAGATAAEALRQAQLQALQAPQPEFRAPSAWAAFIYTGP